MPPSLRGRSWRAEWKIFWIPPRAREPRSSQMTIHRMEFCEEKDGTHRTQIEGGGSGSGERRAVRARGNRCGAWKRSVKWCCSDRSPGGRCCDKAELGTSAPRRAQILTLALRANKSVVKFLAVTGWFTGVFSLFVRPWKAPLAIFTTQTHTFFFPLHFICLILAPPPPTPSSASSAEPALLLLNLWLPLCNFQPENPPMLQWFIVIILWFYRDVATFTASKSC